MSAAPARFASIAERVLAALAWAAALGFAATGICTIVACHLRWPAFDLYRQYVPLLEAPFPANVFALENGHRPVLPNLVKVIDHAWFGPGQAFSTTVALVLGVATLVLLLRAIGRDATLGPGRRAALALGAALAVFWLGNARMLVQATEMLNIQFTAVGLLLGAACLWRAREGGAPTAWGVAAGGCATIATFSFGPGIVAFPALLVAALATAVPWRALAGIAVVFVVVLAVYVLALPGADGVRNSLEIDPATNVLQALQWLAAPLFQAALGLADPHAESWRSAAIAAQFGGSVLRGGATRLQAVIPAHGGWWSGTAVVGLALVATAAAGALHTLRRRRDATQLELVGVALAAFGAAAGLLVAIARHDLFAAYPGQIYAERYLPWSCLFALGVALLVAGMLPRRGGGAIAAIVALAIAFVAWPLHIVAAGWSEAVYDGVERSALAMRLGIWDERVMPNPHDAPRDDVLRAAGLLRDDYPDYYGGSLRAEPYGEATATPSTAVVAWDEPTRFADTRTGRDVVAFAGLLAAGTPRDLPLAVVGANGGVVGVASARADVRQWRDRVWDQGDGVRFAGYAFEAARCEPLRLVETRADAAVVVAELPGCGD